MKMISLTLTSYMKNKLVGFIGALIVVGGGAFYGGLVYGKSHASTSGTPFAQIVGGRRLGGSNGVFGGGVGQDQGNRFGGVSGEVMKKDDKSLTIQLRDGGSKIVFYATSTRAIKAIENSMNDIAVGSTVTVNGPANSDGSVTAQLIQIRPATSTNP